VNYFHIIRKRLITLGVKPKDARVVSLDFDKQVKARGVNSALSYFKDTGDTLIGYLSGSRRKSNWVATYGGFPKHWMVLKDYPVTILLRVAKLARVILLKEPTPAMVSKLKEAAVSPFMGSQEALDALSTFQKVGLAYYNFRIPECEFRFGSVVKASRTFVSKSVPTGTEYGFCLDKVVSCYRAWSGFIHSIPNWEKALYPIHTSWIHSPANPVREISHFVGELGGVMEQGGKLRIFAAPNVLLQTYLEPLQLWLDRIRDQVPTDCYRDQESGALWAQEKLANGLFVQSIDLSSATCRYPFCIQLELLDSLGAPDVLVKLYKAMSRGQWKVQPHLQSHFGESLVWAVGQPLGLSPSMSSFALSHNLVLCGMCLHLGIDPTDSFRIFGDDVVCCDKQLAALYRQVVTQAGIAISEHKSYDSQSYAEFAGYSILPDTLVRPGRWRAPSVLNIQGLVKDLGASVIQELNEEVHLTEKLLSFRVGTFTPEPGEWPLYLFLNSTLFEDSSYQVPLRDLEMEWYDGCTSYLMKQFKGIFFEPPEDTSIFQSVLQRFPEMVPFADEVRACLGIDPDVLPPYRVCVCFEAIASLHLDSQRMIEFIKTLHEQYEAYLWSIPRTDTHIARKKRDAIHKLVAAMPFH